MKFTNLGEDRGMKARPTTTTTVNVPSQVELYHCILDNLVQVRNCGNGVVVRLTQDNFSARAKTLFIRHLALEGFIPDRYQWYSGSSNCAALDVKWAVDGSWVRISHQVNRLSTRALNHLTSGRLVALGLFLAALTTAIWLKSH